MAKIKAIETVYKGYRFRSRLEARWAVFFDSVGIKYIYEPEGFLFQDGTKYLPDFYLPKFYCYFEVKGKDIKGTRQEEEARRKISEGMRTDSWAGIICFGDPFDHDMTLYCQEMDEDGGGIYEARVVFGHYVGTKTPMLFAWDDCKDRTFVDTFENLRIIPAQTDTRYEFLHNPFVTDDIINAELKARQARFEHGETPR